MQKTILSAFAILIIGSASAQKENKPVTVLLQAQYSKTLYDFTRGNNPWAIGTGIIIQLENKGKLKPTLETTVDIYLENDKVARLNNENEIAERVGMSTCVLAGCSYNAFKRLLVSLTGGPCFINGRITLGIRPSLCYRLSAGKTWQGKIYFTNIFNRETSPAKDLGALSFSIALKL
ncbi:hypothetical protein [Foetidibacter luteolus]|uniref:hypothetical protein n=1 Tax=Foetidibacter luteolus TaxID=2608880 RepID=UPI00129B7B4C|nr:hypothetical protein [Foetidibacter luteolus]